MALTTCPDCGSSVSDLAPACPTCGRPMRSPAPTATVPTSQPQAAKGGCAKALLWVGGAFVLLVIVGLFTRDRNAGSSGAGGTPTTAVATWVKSSGFTAVMTKLGADSRAIGSAATAVDLPALRVACRAFQADLPDMLAPLPSPDVDLTAALRSAYDHYTAAARLCLSGVAGNLSDIPRSREEMQAATAAIQQATTVMSRYQ